MSRDKKKSLVLNSFLPAGRTALLDLSGLDASPQSPTSYPEFPTPTDGLTAPSQETRISLLDDELMSLGRTTFVQSWDVLGLKHFLSMMNLT